MKWDLRTWEHKNLFFNVLLKSRNKPNNNIEFRIKEQTQNKRTWTSNKKKTKNKKITWRSPNQRAWPKANTGKWRLTQTREEHRNQNPGTRSQLRENQKPKVQKPQSKPTENQIAKMSPQTPDLWNWTTENQRAKMGPPTPDLRDHKAYDSLFGS